MAPRMFVLAFALALAIGWHSSEAQLLDVSKFVALPDNLVTVGNVDPCLKVLSAENTGNTQTGRKLSGLITIGNVDPCAKILAAENTGNTDTTGGRKLSQSISISDIDPQVEIESDGAKISGSQAITISGGRRLAQLIKTGNVEPVTKIISSENNGNTQTSGGRRLSELISLPSLPNLISTGDVEPTTKILAAENTGNTNTAGGRRLSEFAAATRRRLAELIALPSLPSNLVSLGNVEPVVKILSAENTGNTQTASG